MSRPAHVIALTIVIVCTSACTKRNGIGQPFANPVMLASRDGKLHVELVTDNSELTNLSELLSKPNYHEHKYSKPLARHS